MKCKKCNNEIQFVEGLKFCPICGEPIAEQPENEGFKLADSPEAGYSPTLPAPWENRKLAIFEGFWLTFKESVFNPTAFFSKIPPKGDIFMPLIYAVLWSVIVQVISFFYIKAFGVPFMDYIKEILETQGIPLDGNMMGNYVFMQGVGQILMVPLLYMVMIFIMSGILHVLLLLFGAGKEGYAATFRVMAYSQGSGVFNLIPMVGGMIATVWGIIIQIVGYKEMHRSSYGRVILAVLVVPLFLCAFCCVGLIVLVVSAGGLAGLNY